MNRKQGFTLVELIVAIGLMTMLVMILATILQSAQDMYDLARIRAQMEANGKNAIETLEKDMSRVIPLSTDFVNYEFVMRSQPWDDAIDTPEDEVSNYIETDNKPTEEGDEFYKKCLLTFFASTDYYDPVDKETKYKVCKISYYLKRRSKVTLSEGKTSDRPGAFLVRRIDPYEYIKDTDGSYKLVSNDPVEDDICSYVRGVRLWYYERNADLTDTDIKFVEATKTPESGMPEPDEKLWNDEKEGVLFKMQENWTGSHDAFEQQNFLPPAIMIEIHVIDDNARAYRVLRKIINIPVAPVVLPAKPID